MASASALNMERIVEAKAAHARRCPVAPHTVVLNPFDVDRLGWAVGDTIAGMRLEADPQVQADRGRLVCDASRQPGGERTEVVADDRDEVLA